MSNAGQLALVPVPPRIKVHDRRGFGCAGTGRWCRFRIRRRDRISRCGFRVSFRWLRLRFGRLRLWLFGFSRSRWFGRNGRRRSTPPPPHAKRSRAAPRAAPQIRSLMTQCLATARKRRAVVSTSDEACCPTYSPRLRELPRAGHRGCYIQWATRPSGIARAYRGRLAGCCITQHRANGAGADWMSDSSLHRKEARISAINFSRYGKIRSGSRRAEGRSARPAFEDFGVRCCLGRRTEIGCLNAEKYHFS